MEDQKIFVWLFQVLCYFFSDFLTKPVFQSSSEVFGTIRLIEDFGSFIIITAWIFVPAFVSLANEKYFLV